MLRHVTSQAVKTLGINEAIKQLTQVKCNRLLFADSKTIKCWKCGAFKSDKLFCDKCSVLQEPDKKLTYFDVMGIERRYNLQPSELTSKFRKLQSILHPDRFSNKEKEELAVSETYSSLVNEAYSTLLNPLERGLYLLRLEGLSIEEGSVQLDPIFLAEIMELNEELADTNDPNTVLKLASENQIMIDELSKQVDKAFLEKNMQEAKSLLSKMKYYSSFEEKIKDAKQKLGIVA